jgi:hypothetical protein
LPGGEALAPRCVMAVHVVDLPGDSVVARAIAVILPVAVVVPAGVVEDEVEDDGNAYAVSCIDQLDEFRYRLIGASGVQVFRRKHVGGPVAFAGSACGVSLEIRDGKQLDGVETQIPYIRKAILEFNKSGGGDGQIEAVIAAREGSDVELVDKKILEGGVVNGARFVVNRAGLTI